MLKWWATDRLRVELRLWCELCYRLPCTPFRCESFVLGMPLVQKQVDCDNSLQTLLASELILMAYQPFLQMNRLERHNVLCTLAKFQRKLVILSFNFYLEVYWIQYFWLRISPWCDILNSDKIWAFWKSDFPCITDQVVVDTRLSTKWLHLAWVRSFFVTWRHTDQRIASPGFARFRRNLSENKIKNR